MRAATPTSGAPHSQPSMLDAAPSSPTSSLGDRVEDITPNQPSDLPLPLPPSIRPPPPEGEPPPEAPPLAPNLGGGPSSPPSPEGGRIEDITPVLPSNLRRPPSPSTNKPPPKLEQPPKGAATSTERKVQTPITVALPPAVLMSCSHDEWQLAAGVLPLKHDIPLCEKCSPSSHPPWWQRPHSACAIRCQHGFALALDSSLLPPCHCSLSECRATAGATLTSAKAAHPRFPSRKDPIRWVGEFDSRSQGTLLALPLYLASPFEVVAMHEHTGAFRDAWSEEGFRAASVCNRPSSNPPVGDSIHFISDVVEWRSHYAWSIPCAIANPDCHTAAIAASNSSVWRWRGHMRSGALRRAVEHFSWVLSVAELVAVEQPPSLLAYVFGPPSVETCLADFGVPRRKRWNWWLRGLPPVPPSGRLSGPQPSTHHEFDDLPPDLRSIARAETPREFALAHVSAWSPMLRRRLEEAPPHKVVHPQKPPPPPRPYPSLAEAHSALTLVSAALLAPRFPHALPQRCVVLIPAARLEGIPVLLLPDYGFFGTAVVPTADLDKAAAGVASLLGCSSEPMLAHTHASGDTRHFVYVSPADHAPCAASLASHPPNSDKARWVTEAQIAGSPERVYASLALRRLDHIFRPVGGDDAAVGVSGPPIPCVPERTSREWMRAPAHPEVEREWRAFVERDKLEAEAFKKELVACDRGDGRMIEWSATITSVADIEHELVPPPQGLPQMPPKALWAPYPDLLAVPKPLPLTSHMLARLPPQSVPPGPIPKHASEALKGWFIKALFETTDAIIEREAYFFHNPPPGGFERRARGVDKPRP